MEERESTGRFVSMGHENHTQVIFRVSTHTRMRTRETSAHCSTLEEFSRSSQVDASSPTMAMPVSLAITHCQAPPPPPTPPAPSSLRSRKLRSIDALLTRLAPAHRSPSAARQHAVCLHRTCTCWPVDVAAWLDKSSPLLHIIIYPHTFRACRHRRAWCLPAPLPAL